MPQILILKTTQKLQAISPDAPVLILADLNLVTKRVKVWTDESLQSLQGCYECTDWEMFKESCLNIDVLTDVQMSVLTFPFVKTMFLFLKKL